MTAKELQQSNKTALKVIKTDSNDLFVESEDGKVLYHVVVTNEIRRCTCSDFIRNSKNDPHYLCSHLISLEEVISNGSCENGAVIENNKPKLDPRFIIKIEDKEFVQYQGLLDLAHQKGLIKIAVEPLQFPSKDNGNFAICKALVIGKDNVEYWDIGDASPNNTNARVSKHVLRMAATRAVARALRNYTNVGMTALEELEIEPETTGKNNKTRKKSTRSQETSPPPQSIQSPSTSTTQTPTTQNKISTAQKRALNHLARRKSISDEALQNMAREAYGTSVESMNFTDAASFIRSLQSN